MRVITRRRSPSSGGDSVVQLSVPREELRVLATDLGVPPSKSGTLLKYTNVVKRWKLRHFTLENGVLNYSSASSDEENDDEEHTPPNSTSPDRERRSRKKSRRRRLLRRGNSKEDNEREIKGSINIQHAVISADDSDSCRFAIDVGHDVFHCKAESRALRDEWVQELNRSIAYFRGLIQRAVARAQESANNIEKHIHIPNGVTTNLPGHSEHNSAPTTPNPTAMPHGAAISEESEDSVLEDDGLKEAEQSHKALVTELRRIVLLWRQRWMETSSTLDDERNLLTTLSETFMDASDPVRKKGGTAPEIAKGLVDLVTWCLHVLQTNDDVFDRRLKADLTRRMAGGLPVFPPTSPRATNSKSNSPTEADFSPINDDSDSEFVDALSHAASKRSSISRHVSLSDDREADSITPSKPQSSKEISAKGDMQSTTEVSKRKSSIRRVSTATLMKGYKGSRTHLPRLEGSRERTNIFGVLKDAVGKDLSKISLPVGLNEPLSFVQRLAEDIEYCELLDKAAEESDANRRMMYVAAMVISHYSSTQGRVGKPFNPLLGETACLVRPDKGKGVRFLSEQVSHHPPISACYAEGTGGSWKYYNAIEVKNKFWGKSLEVFPTGLNHIEIPKYGDHYVLEQVTACVHNIVVGRLWLDNYGDMEIVNRNDGTRCKIEFSKTGWMSDAKSFAAIKGIVYDANGKEAIKIGGNWTQSVYEDLGRGKKNIIWTVEERPPEGASQSYNMTKWAITLNAEVSEAERKMLPPTDSRLRPDQRALEQGKLELGSRIKQTLEEGQRQRRREMEEQGRPWEPLWFEKVTDEVTGQTDYRFNGNFFKQQALADWSMCPDIFACAESVSQT